VDARFQLERALGTAPLAKEDAVKRLERMFSMADTFEGSENPDWAAPPPPGSPPPSPDARERADGGAAGGSSSSGAASSSGGGSGGLPAPRRKSALRQYVEGFDQATMVETARIVSAEGGALVERQTSAIFGDIKRLTKQMQDAVGAEVESAEDLMQRVAAAIEGDKVETLTMTQTVQRRAVLEAVAYGAYLRDIETWVQTDYGALLTPSPGRMGGGGGGSMGGGAAMV
jgi:hypothetical protein